MTDETFNFEETMWRGRPLKVLSREELLEVIRWFHYALEQANKDKKQYLDLFASRPYVRP